MCLISLLLTHKYTETMREWVIWSGNNCGTVESTFHSSYDMFGGQGPPSCADETYYSLSSVIATEWRVQFLHIQLLWSLKPDPESVARCCCFNVRRIPEVFLGQWPCWTDLKSITSIFARLKVQSRMMRGFFLHRPTRNSEDDEDDEKKGKGCTLQVLFDQFLWDL